MTNLYVFVVRYHCIKMDGSEFEERTSVGFVFSANEAEAKARVWDNLGNDFVYDMYVAPCNDDFCVLTDYTM